VEQAVQDAWREASETVWREDLEGYAGVGTRTIWERQIGGFWDMSWVLVDERADTAALDRRKNWRTYLPPDEPGVKCMVMDGWQELSGGESPLGEDGRRRRERLWEALELQDQRDGREGKRRKGRRRGRKGAEKEKMILKSINAIQERISRADDSQEKAYLHYNLGVNYQLLGRINDAESEYSNRLELLQQQLAKVFGLVSFSPGFIVESSLEAIEGMVFPLFSECHKKLTDHLSADSPISCTTRDVPVVPGAQLYPSSRGPRGSTSLSRNGNWNSQASKIRWARVRISRNSLGRRSKPRKRKEAT